MGIFDAHFSGLDPSNAPGRVAQQDDVPGQTLHRKVFIHRTDHRTLRLGDDGVIRGIGDRAARGNRRQAGSAPGAQAPIDPIVMQVRASSSPARVNAVGEHLDHRVEIFPVQTAVGIGAPAEVEQFVFLPFAGGHRRHDLLGQDIHRGVRHVKAIERP